MMNRPLFLPLPLSPPLPCLPMKPFFFYLNPVS